MSEKPTGAQETQPKLEQLRQGTWGYSIDIFDRNHFGEQQPLSLEETQARLNEFFAKVNAQGGRVVQLIELDVKGKPRPGIMGDIRDKAYILIVEKP